MVELHKSKYFQVCWEAPQELFYYVFNEQTSDMCAEEYIDELRAFIRLVKKYQPRYVLGDMVDFGFVITPDIQEWVNENLFTVYQEIGFKKIAILMSKEFVASLSIEQTMEENRSNSFQTAFFENEKMARAWLEGKVSLREVYC
ncbi:MAG: STAS/SEC14 domain-containing protein [Microscillaceae bacterium]|nr:STAS/SEC14 domain-containing protein [Microscillaceae bacterium]